jgi:hypothetical protein
MFSPTLPNASEKTRQLLRYHPLNRFLSASFAESALAPCTAVGGRGTAVSVLRAAVRSRADVLLSTAASSVRASNSSTGRSRSGALGGGSSSRSGRSGSGGLRSSSHRTSGACAVGELAGSSAVSRSCTAVAVLRAALSGRADILLGTTASSIWAGGSSRGAHRRGGRRCWRG